MKSILQEASSIAEAIDKAWSTAGKPAEFTVKVLCEGEKNFLGFSKHPAIVSLVYQPNKQTISHARTTQRRPHPEQRPRRTVQKTRDAGYGKNYEQKPEQKKQEPPKPREYWNTQLIENITGWLKEMMVIMNNPTDCTHSIDNKRLTIVLTQSPLDGAADETLLLSSMSKLLLQALQRQHKRKLNGYSLMITTKQHQEKRSAANKR